ncbi:MAG: chemotaxis protein CheX [Nannocystaceae bacterium]
MSTSVVAAGQETSGGAPNEIDRALGEMLLAAAPALFEGHGVALDFGAQRPVLDPVAHEGYAGILGFGGTGIKGSVAIYLDDPTVRKSYPSAGSLAGTDEDILYLRDWTAELTNQLMGRLKNKLLRSGVDVMLGIPTAVSGVSFTLAYPGQTIPQAYDFLWDEGAAVVVLTAEAVPGLTLEEIDDPDAASAGEGELILF